MALFQRQIWTLIRKNIRIVLMRHTASTLFRAFWLPVIYVVILGYIRNIFIPPSKFGIATSTPVRSLVDAMDAVTGSRTTIAFVNSGLSGGDIDKVVANVAAPLKATGKDVQFLTHDTDLLATCRSSLRGVSDCFAAAVFYSSPSEGTGGIWNYTIRVDGALGTKVDVGKTNNDAEIYTIPLQHSIDFAIAALNTTIDQAGLPVQVDEFMFSTMTQKQRAIQIRQNYMNGIAKYTAVTFLLASVGVIYQETGFIARERELGVSQLIEAMMPNHRRWQPQAARLMAYHQAFSIIYLPGWILMSLIMRFAIFSSSSVLLILFFMIISGLALSSWAVFLASFFNRAQLSGIVGAIVSIILGIIAQIVSTHANAGTVAILSLLFPPMNFVFFVISIARFEHLAVPVNLLRHPPGGTSDLEPIVQWVFFIIQIPGYQLLGALLERYFYGTASKARVISWQDEGATNSVTLSNFTKVYHPNFFHRRIAPLFGRRKETVIAVNNLTLTVAKGQIMVLLGANGSGKSTVIESIAGLNRPTSGSIDINGCSGIGICPQKNVLWDELTVEEHVRIFNRLKSIGPRDTKEETRELIKRCDMDRKIKARAKTLSGGQKRKLQLALMFTGGSRICCIDEVSSGLDPLSRRKIWDILLAERSRITQIFTTHYLDEADLLADHIAILSKGTLRAEGTSVALKNTMGTGYRVAVHHEHGSLLAPEIEGVSRAVAVDRTTYSTPDCAATGRLIDELESRSIHNYQVSGPTIEDVFLQLAEEVELEEKNNGDQSTQNSTVEHGKLGEEVNAVELHTLPSSLTNERGLALLTGKRIGVLLQAWMLLRKRVTIVQRNYLPSIAAFTIPIIAAGLVTIFVKGYSLGSCVPGDLSDAPDINSLSGEKTLDLVFGPSSSFSTRNFELLASLVGVHSISNATSLLSSVNFVESLEEFKDFINANFSTVTPGGLFLGNATQPPVFTYIGNKFTEGLYAPILVQSALDTLLTNITISAQFMPFATPLSPLTGNSLQLITYLGLAMTAYPAFFALYPTLERLRSVRALQYSNGVRALPLWLSHLSFDWIIALVASTIAIIIFVAVSRVWFYIGYLYVVFFLYAMASILLGYFISLWCQSMLASYAVMAGYQAVMLLLYLIAIMSVYTYAPIQKIDSQVLIVHFSMAIISPIGNLARALFVSLNVFQISCHGDVISKKPGDIRLYGGPIVYLLMQSFVLFGILLWYDSGSFLPKWFRKTVRVRSRDDEDITDPDILREIQNVRNSTRGLRVLNVTKAFGSNVAVEDVTFGIGSGEVFALLGPNGAGKSTVISLIRGDIRPQKGGDILAENISVIMRRALARSHLGVCPQFDAMDQMTVLEHLRFYARIRGVTNVEYNVKEVVRAVGLQAFSNKMASKLSGGNKRKLSLGIALMGDPSVLLLDEPSSGLDPASKRVMWKKLEAVSPGRSILLTTHSMEEANALASRAGIMSKRMLAMGTTDSLRHKFGDVYYVHLVTTTAPHTPADEMERIRAWIVEHIPDATIEEKTYHGQMRFAVPARSGPDLSSPTPAAQSNEKTEPAVDEIQEVSPISTNTSITQQNKNSKTELVDEIKEISQPVIDIKDYDGSAKTGNISALFTLLEANKALLGLEYYSVSQTTLDQVFLKIVGQHQIEEEGYAAPPARGLWMRLFSRS